MTRRASGEGSIGKRDDGSFYATVQLEGKRRWVYGATRKEVSDKMKALREKVEQGIDLDANKVTVGVFLLRWLEDVVKVKNKPSTYESYRVILKHHLLPTLGSLHLASLRSERVQGLLNDLSKQGKAPRTVRNVRAVLRRALNQAVRWRVLTHNAAGPVELPRAKQYEEQPLTADEARRLLAGVRGHPREALYTVALFLGLRKGEVLGLLISDLDLEANTVKVTGTLQWIAGRLVRGEPKSQSGYRTLPVPATLVALLRAHLERQQALFPDNSYVFASTNGTPINPRNLTRQFKDVLTKAKLRDVRFHTLRHTCASLMVAQGEHPKTVQEVLGHSEISTTMNIYAHTFTEARTAAVEGIAELLSPPDVVSDVVLPCKDASPMVQSRAIGG